MQGFNKKINNIDYFFIFFTTWIFTIFFIYKRLSHTFFISHFVTSMATTNLQRNLKHFSNYTVPKNNLNLCIKAELVTAGAYCILIVRKNPDILVHRCIHAPVLTGSVCMRRFRFFLAQLNCILEAVCSTAVHTVYCLRFCSVIASKLQQVCKKKIPLLAMGPNHCSICGQSSLYLKTDRYFFIYV